MKTEELVVLIVEDDHVFGIKLKNWLETKVKDVFLAESFKEGVSIASRIKPDVIFLDNMMPDNVNNLKSIKDFKEHFPPVATIISMSASYTIEHVAIGIQKGVEYMIDKKDLTKSYVYEILDAIIESKQKKESLWRILDIFKSKSKSKDVTKITIIEDDELFSFHMNWILDQKPISVIVNTFSKAENFYNYFKSEIPDIIFLDYNLPDGNGEEVLKFIKDKKQNIKVILISSQEDSDVGIKLKMLGADGYIVKNKDWKTNFNLLLNDLKF